MKKHTTSTAIPTHVLKAEALASMSASFERFCLAAGLETLSEMLEQDATAACGERHERGERRQAHRWGRTKGKIGFHGALDSAFAPSMMNRRRTVGSSPRSTRLSMSGQQIEVVKPGFHPRLHA